MSKLNVELCPETGISSIIKTNGEKIDHMPDEVATLRDAAKDPDAVRNTLATVDSAFAEGLDPAEITEVTESLK